VVESAPKQDGRNMTMVLNPIRKPKAKQSGNSEKNAAVEASTA
jgi:hypothetical protein